MNVEKGVHISNFIFNSSAKMINNKFVFILFAEFCFIASRLPSANLPFIRPTTKFVFAFFFFSVLFCSFLSLRCQHFFSSAAASYTYLSPTQISLWPIEELMPHWFLDFVEYRHEFSVWYVTRNLLCLSVCVCGRECLCVGLIRKHFFRLFANAANSRCFVFFGLTEIRNEAYCNWAPFRG